MVAIIPAALLAFGLATTYACPHGHQGHFKKHTIKAKGIEASFIEHGATLTNLWVNDKDGVKRDIVLGWDDTTQYNLDAGNPGFLCAVVGRYANRIKNGTFTLDGEEYHTPLNEKDMQTLHGGDLGFNRLNWTLADKGKDHISFNLVSRDGDEGFPGTVDVTVTYRVNDKQEWHVDYTGNTDKDTIMMLSQHTYWNLDAFTTSATVNDHVMQIASDKYIETDGVLIPTGDFGRLDGTPLDFRHPKPIGKDIEKADKCGDGCIGYDNAFIFSEENPEKAQVQVYAPGTGIELSIKTNQPALQFYSCNSLNGTLPTKKTQGDASGGVVGQYGCFVLETQNYIDGINNPQWGEKHSGILRKGETYHHRVIYKFGIHQ